MARVWRWTLLLGALSAGAPVHAQQPDESELELASESESPPIDTADELPAPPSSAEPAEALPPPPTAGYVPPQGYAPPPGWDPGPRPSREVRRRRVSLRYREGMTVPQGGSLVTRRPRGLLVPGLIGFTVTYLMNLVGSTLDEDNGIIAIPLVGLPIHQARDGDSYWAPMVAVHTLVQAAALTMLVLGLIPRRYVEYFTLAGRSNGEGPRWALTPTTTRRGAGVALTVF